MLFGRFGKSAETASATSRTFQDIVFEEISEVKYRSSIVSGAIHRIIRAEDRQWLI
jgi:hypothetical protein